MKLLATAAPVTYACPMHPEVTSDQPGRCPQCGMKLLAAPAGHPAGRAVTTHHGGHGPTHGCRRGPRRARSHDHHGHGTAPASSGKTTWWRSTG